MFREMLLVTQAFTERLLGKTMGKKKQKRYAIISYGFIKYLGRIFFLIFSNGYTHTYIQIFSLYFEIIT